MKLKDITVGTKIEVIAHNRSGEEVKPSFISQVEEIGDHNTILISAPIYEGRIIPFHTDTVLKIVFCHQNGFYSFKGKVEGRGRKKNVIVLQIQIVSEFNKIQRREYFRFNCILPIKYRVVDEEDMMDDENNTTFHEGLTRDISGGGLGIITKNRQQLDDIIEFQLDLKDDSNITGYGKVVRSRLSERDITRFDTGILFSDISKIDREKIIQFIFKQQIKLKQKGML